MINALHGYLHRLEGLSPVEGMSLEQGSNVCDYPLFPQGPLPGGRKGQGVADPERHMRVKIPSIVSDFRPLRKQTRKH